jgi:hypothetical protein
MDRRDHRECQQYPDPQDRKEPCWIDARRLFAEKLEKLRLEEEAGREGDGQGYTHDEVEGAKDPEEDSGSAERAGVGSEQVDSPVNLSSNDIIIIV